MGTHHLYWAPFCVHVALPGCPATPDRALLSLLFVMEETSFDLPLHMADFGTQELLRVRLELVWAVLPAKAGPMVGASLFPASVSSGI
jgi:hypothetical protein